MYGLPFGFDGSFLIGKELEQICFNSNQVVFGFSGSVKIILGSSYSFGKDDNFLDVEPVQIPVKNSDLMLLIGERIVEVKWNREGTLILVFEKGRALSIFDDSKEYESYEIHNGQVTVIV